ncbi:MAG: hypothetical protein IJ374_01010 [Lachnospiraceae bacterium]|nr:hypothetical protein [Lachnospiraceae bacterium]
MKHMKKLAGILCAAAIAAAMGLTAFAATGTDAQMPTNMPNYTPMPFDGTVVSVENGQLTMNRNLGWGTEEMIVYLTEETKILDAVNGYPVPVENLGVGEAIRVYAGLTMTMSLPPITNGMVVLCDIPADAGFPIYTDVQELKDNGAGGYTLTTIDGTVVTVDTDTMLLPYLTRNMVRPENLVPGTTILLWRDAVNLDAAYKIVVFQNEEGFYPQIAMEPQVLQGWKQTEEGWYFYENGELKKGWLLDGGDWYYLNPETGLMHTGFITLEGKTYFLKEDGRMLTEAHVFVPDESGELHF